jgi:hypothetical protein
MGSRVIRAAGAALASAGYAITAAANPGSSGPNLRSGILTGPFGPLRLTWRTVRQTDLKGWAAKNMVLKVLLATLIVVAILAQRAPNVQPKNCRAPAEQRQRPRLSRWCGAGDQR